MEGKFIKLENGLKFMVLSTHELDGEKYLYLASVTEEIKYIFVKFISEDVIEPVEDMDTIYKLQCEVAKNLKEKLDA